ncbi:MAG: hypothetical protein ABSG97_03965 [Sedimentisphaerales bacterium]|jgi:hypothetical protein
MAKINLDLSKLKDLMKGLGGLRVYLVLIWPAVILLACGAVLAAAWLMGSSLKQKVAKESIPIGNEVKQMLKQLPVAGQAQVERQYQDAYQQDANLIKLLSVETSQRELLSYDIFPKPKDTSTLLFTRFGAKYCQGVEGLIAKDRGGDCPDAEELRNARLTGGIPGSSAAGGASSRIVEEICHARAKSVSIYAVPESVGGYDFWKAYQYSNIEDSVKDCWFWQVGYWIIEDVFSAAGAMNAGSSSVLTSPVKRVERVGFVAPDALFSTGAGTGKTTSQGKPKYVTKPEEQLTESFTGRVSNEDIDVVHFGLVVVVSNKAIIPFMRELCSAKEHEFRGFTGQEPAKVFKHNQITILESRAKPVDLTSADHRYYRYGADSVVEIELVCEYIFNRNGYDEIKPESIKNLVTKTGT